MGLLHPDPDESRTDRIRRIAFWIIVLTALAIVAVAMSSASGRWSVPDVTTP